MTTPKNAVDHLILFLPADPATNLPKIPDFISQNFTLTPGGVHADGLTSNTLILLPTGAYLELITFIPSRSTTTSPPPPHRWRPFATSPGWTDWCLTNTLSAENSHTHHAASHATPIRGGRTRADGVEVKWAVTPPLGDKAGAASVGRVPFFCHDETPREVRVPLSEEGTRHACGAVGVREVNVVVGDTGLLEETKGVYEGLFGKGVEETKGVYEGLFGKGVEEGEGVVVFEGSRVGEVEGLEGGVRVVLRGPRDEGEKERVGERGVVFGDVVFAARGGAGKGAGQRERLDGGGDDVRGLWVEYF